MTDSIPCDWIVDGPTTLHGYEDDQVYLLILADTDDPELQRDVALVGAWDVEGEQYAQMIAAVPKLLAACQAVVDRWEHGDLAEAARMCQAAVDQALDQKAGQAGPAGCPVCGNKPLAFPHPQATHCSAECFLASGLKSASGHKVARDSEPTSTEKLNNLLEKAEKLGLESSDLDDAVHELAASIAADVNNVGLEDQLKYLLGEMGGEATAKELDRLAAEKAEGKDDE